MYWITTGYIAGIAVAFSVGRPLVQTLIFSFNAQLATGKCRFHTQGTVLPPDLSIHSTRDAGYRRHLSMKPRGCIVVLGNELRGMKVDYCLLRSHLMVTRLTM